MEDGEYVTSNLTTVPAHVDLSRYGRQGMMGANTDAVSSNASSSIQHKEDQQSKETVSAMQNNNPAPLADDPTVPHPMFFRMH